MEGVIILNIEAYCKATIIKTLWFWHRDRHRDQRNRTESPEARPHIVVNYFSTKLLRTFNKKEKFLFNKKESDFSDTGSGTMDYPHAKDKFGQGKWPNLKMGKRYG